MFNTSLALESIPNSVAIPENIIVLIHVFLMIDDNYFGGYFIKKSNKSLNDTMGDFQHNRIQYSSVQ